VEQVAFADDADELCWLSSTGAALIRFSRNSSATSFTVVEGFTVITGATMTSRASIAPLPH
jgi:hypothetical protein